MRLCPAFFPLRVLLLLFTGVFLLRCDVTFLRLLEGFGARRRDAGLVLLLTTLVTLLLFLCVSVGMLDVLLTPLRIGELVCVSTRLGGGCNITPLFNR